MPHSIQAKEKALEYNQYIRSKWIVLVTLIIVLLAICVLSISVGSRGFQYRKY
jgi:hypothetical protein